MSLYESQSGVEPARIATYRRLRQQWRRGTLTSSGGPRYEDFFSDDASSLVDR
ncbi:MULTISPECIES: hypothetical protein [unclassified Curtobacterium]|uniref:hypothetical protein n=1 Tax=unclassified Curtobacterium TaxID=257496 RepID=UPI0015E8CE05|nr:MULTISPECIES: hypothetical protein [unclassified Curtobacterium]WIB64949.1 hypothetical protein DEI94_07135 [Curtobacterium sp. MCBD17_040]WIB68810.1 hypothetical protein DEI93_07210 [Curtobacterium sp. MCBD17_035]WIE55972.1 hypothetical protein DEI88_007205 [Curtobacterium sp. MCBD17_003]